MKHFDVPSIYGIVKDYHQRMIPENKLSDGLNIMFREGKMINRWGYAALGGNLPLNGAVTNIILYELLSTAVQHILAFTTRDAYVYDASAGQFDFITMCYSRGTVNVSGTAVTLSSGEWRNTDWNKQGVYQIKFGNQDVNGSGTWYIVSKVDGPITLTLATSGGSETGVQYVLRLCWSGNIDNPHSITTAYDDILGEKILIVANGIEPLRSWKGSDLMYDLGSMTGDTHSNTTIDNLANTSHLYVGQLVTGWGVDSTIATVTLSPPSITLDDAATQTNADTMLNFGTMRIARFVGFFGSTGYEHLITAFVKEGPDNRPQTLDVSHAGKPEIWGDDIDAPIYYDLLNTNDEIQGVVPLQTRMLIYKRHSITEMWATPGGGNIDPYDFNQNKISDIGTPSIRTVVNFGSFHIFLSDDNIYQFNGTNLTSIGTEIINSLISESNRPYMNRAFAFSIRDEDLYVLFMPVEEDYCDKAYVYNYMEKTWTIWETNHQMTANGVYIREYSPTWAELEASGELWSEMGQRWSDLIFYENNTRYVLGDKDGYIYEFSPDWTNDDGVANPININIVTRDYPINDRKHCFHLRELVMGIDTQSAGNIMVRASIDFGETWSGWAILSLVGASDYVERIANFIERGRQVRFQIQNLNGTPFGIESLIIGYNDGGVIR